MARLAPADHEQLHHVVAASFWDPAPVEAALAREAQLTGRPMRYEFVETLRRGDHVCYLSDLTKLRRHYPEWDVAVPLDAIFEEIVAS